jgi:hypothetical protein
VTPRFELFQADSEDRIVPFDLVAEYFDCSIDTCPSAGHQPVQVGPAHKRHPCAEGNTRDDVGARHDSGVDVHFHVGTNLAHHVW